MASLLEYLRRVPDPRRAQGRRYPLEVIITMMLMGTMAGRIGYRSVGRFCKQFESELVEIFGLRHGVPSHVTLTHSMESIDLESLVNVLNAWALDHAKPSAGSFVALDGKAVKASVNHGLSESQNFVAFVNAFCHEKGLVIGALPYENKTGSEIETVRDLIEKLGLKGAIFTLDANHDSKKP